jgi:hypothetical protein
MNPKAIPFKNIPVEFRHPLRPPKTELPEPVKRETHAFEEGRGGVIVPKRYHHNPPRNRY